MTFDELLALPQYSLDPESKQQHLGRLLNELTEWHRERCAPYARILRAWRPRPSGGGLADIPFLPVGLFKSHRLSSVPDSEVFKTLTSSGTTGQQVSQIVLDRVTAQRQTLALSRIMTHVLGPERLPMILVESRNLIGDRARFNARAAGTLGMMNFGRDHFYALDDQMKLQEDGLRAFLEKHRGKRLLIFGFTFMVWQYLFQQIKDSKFDLSRAVLIHSGGWKKLQEMAVSNSDFRQAWAEDCGLREIHNFYGMVEQVGSVYVEGAGGWLYAPNFSEVVIRHPQTLEPVGAGETGIIEVLSVLPLSYPGHAILTEDLGVAGPLDPAAAWKGVPFRVIGRVPRAELRGCSDVHASQAA